MKKTGEQKRVAFVVQRCGPEVNGGAEKECLDVALLMKDEWQVEILTTCAKEYQQWANFYKEGEDVSSGVKIRRFPVVKQRNMQQFNAYSARVNPSFAPVPPSLQQQERWMKMQGPDAPKLLSYLRHHSAEYDAIIFFTYLYATTYFGIQEVRGKTPCYLVPFAHQEWMLTLPMWDRCFASLDGVLFSTPEEKALLKHRFPHLHLDGHIAGSAIHPPKDISSKRFRNGFNIEGPFILYIGRVEPSKGCKKLFEYFLKALESFHEEVSLVLLGEAYISIPSHRNIIHLGFVEEQVKWDALAACELLVLPSEYESLSLVLLEAWASERGVLVNGACDVLKEQCKRSHGGLWYRDCAEFTAALNLLLEKERGMNHIIGKQGKEFVSQHYTKDAVKNAFKELIQKIC